VPTSSRRVPTQKRTIIILVILLFTDLYMFYFYGSHSSHQSHQLAQYYARQKTHHKNPVTPYVVRDAR
ncbi:hypothetical protein, partial [Escherichia coli]|uniref:hypothetical protein n=1 Tax=Escherichia coli TaxID=562 RepID=UPI003EE3828B